MVDFAKLIGWREPIEIYLAAVGDPEPLALRILEDEPLTELERRTLAAFIRGELTPPKRKRGQKRLSYLPGTIEDVHETIMQNAVLDYHHIMAEVKKKTGTKHKMKSAVAEYIADRDGMDVEKLLYRIDHPKPLSSTRTKESSPPRPVRNFHEWLHRTGRLDGYPRFIGSAVDGAKS